MRRFLPILVGLLVLGLSAYGCYRYARHQIRHGITVEVRSAGTQLGADGALALVELGLEVTNRSVFTGRYEGIEGTLEVAGQTLPWTVEGIEVGDEVRGGEAVDLTVEVELSLTQVVAMGWTVMWTRKVEISFVGDVEVSALGIEVKVPVEDQRTLSLPDVEFPGLPIPTLPDLSTE